MGNEIEPIIFGGAKVFNATKTKVKQDAKKQPVYCVWLEGGAYAEYPEQKTEPVPSYYAKDLHKRSFHPITEKDYKEGKTTKDGWEYEFSVEYDSQPTMYSEKDKYYPDMNVYEESFNGFKGLTVYGSKNGDTMYIKNTSNARVVVNNDKERDIVNISVDCKNVNVRKGAADEISRFIGYDIGGGYSNKFINR